MIKSANPLTADNPMVSAMRMLTAMPLGAPQMRQFWRAQDQFLREMQDYSEGWFERRHTGTQSALSTASQIANPENPGEALRDLADWQAHSMERVMEDWQALFTTMARCGEILVRNETETAAENAKAAEATAKSGNATPV